VIEHRELKDHPIEVVTVGLASLQHCDLIVQGFIVAHRPVDVCLDPMSGHELG
jgi:hypothetical protein